MAILVDKYANHRPLNRQSEQCAREGIELSLSTMADHVGACTAVLMPIYELIKAHVFAAERIHRDATTLPVLTKVMTRTGRRWIQVRDDRPFGGTDPPAAVFFYSADRGGIHPEQHLAGYSTRKALVARASRPAITSALNRGLQRTVTHRAAVGTSDRADASQVPEKTNSSAQAMSSGAAETNAIC